MATVRLDPSFGGTGTFCTKQAGNGLILHRDSCIERTSETSTARICHILFHGEKWQWRSYWSRIFLRPRDMFGSCRNHSVDGRRGRFVGRAVVVVVTVAQFTLSAVPAQSRVGIASFTSSFWATLGTWTLLSNMVEKSLVLPTTERTRKAIARRLAVAGTVVPT